MKKLIILFIAMITLTSVGCTGTGNNFTQEEKASKQPEKIVLWSYFETVAQNDMLNDLAKRFNASQNQYVVEWDYVPMVDFNKRLSMGLADNNLPDLVIIDNPNMDFYISLGLFEDITDKIADWKDKDQYYKTAWQATMYHGRCYGIPFACNSVGLFYNVDMFNKAGLAPPKTWEEFKTDAKKLTGNGVYGFGMSAIQSEQGTFQFLPWMYSTNTYLTSFDYTGGTKAFQLIADLVKEGSLSKECINWSQNDVAKKFISGKLAMMENGPWVFPAIEEANVNFKWNVAKLPIDKNYSVILGGEDVAVIKGKNVDGAMSFIRFMGSPENVKKTILTYGSIPPRRDVAMQPEWSQNPKWNVFMEQMDYATLRLQNVRWPTISDTISEQLSDVIVGTTTPNEATKKLRDAIQAILQ